MRLKHSMTGRGHGAPPVMKKRSLPPRRILTMCMTGPRKPIFMRNRATADFARPASIFACIFSASSGTAQMTVGFKSWMSWPTVRRDWQKLIDAPFIIEAMKFAENEKAWKSGRTTKKESRSVTVPKSVNAPSKSAMKFPCVSIAPLGLPVVPDV